MADIKITLETLYDILRNEKKKEDLQRLEAAFFLDVVQYLREKQALLENKAKSQELFAAGERDKLEYELRSIKRILKEIYEKREKKVLEIALNKSRTGSDIIDTSAMLHEEREFYLKTLKIMDDFRKGILLKLYQGEMPKLPDQKELEVEFGMAEKKGVEAGREIKENMATPFTRFEPAILEPERKVNIPPQTTPSPIASPLTASSPLTEAMAKIRFTRPTPRFIWKDMKEYGPFDPGEELEIYPEVADLIVRKGRAVKV